MINCSDEVKYSQWQEQQLLKWEALCDGCGACCGIVDGDPCEHLNKLENGRYTCNIYESRFGVHKTISGLSLKCVPIRDILHKSWPGRNLCSYKNKAV